MLGECDPADSPRVPDRRPLNAPQSQQPRRTSGKHSTKRYKEHVCAQSCGTDWSSCVEGLSTRSVYQGCARHRTSRAGPPRRWGDFACVCPPSFARNPCQNSLYCHRQLHSNRPPLPDVPAVYFVSPTLANIRRIAQDLEKGLYESFHLNFVEPLPRALLEDLAAAVAKDGTGELVEQVRDTDSYDPARVLR